MTNNQISSVLSMRQVSPSAPPVLELNRQLANIQATKQDKLTESNRLPSEFIYIDSEKTLAQKITELQTIVDQNNSSIQTIEGGGISTITTEDEVTTISGTTHVDRLLFSGDNDSNIFQTTAYTDELDVSLVWVASRISDISSTVDGLITDVSSQKDRVISLSGEYDALFDLVGQNTRDISDVSAVLFHLETNVGQLQGDISTLSGEVFNLNNSVLDISADISMLMGDICGNRSWLAPLETSANFILGYQASQDLSIVDIRTNISGINGFIDDITTSLEELTQQIHTNISNVEILTVSYENLDMSLSDYVGIVNTLTTSYEQINIETMDASIGNLEDAIGPLQNWDTSLSSIEGAITTIQNATQYITSQTSESEGDRTILESALYISPDVSQNTPLTITTYDASDKPIYMNWEISTAADGIVQDRDVVMRTNCERMAFVNEPGLKGLTVGLADGNPTVLHGSDLSINGDLYTSEIQCDSLNVTGPISANVFQSIKSAALSSNVITMDYALGTVFSSTYISANFVISITNIPTTEPCMYIFKLIYNSSSNYPTNVTVADINETELFNAAPQWSNSPSSVSGSPRMLELIVIHSSSLSSLSNRVIAKLESYAAS